MPGLHQAELNIPIFISPNQNFSFADPITQKVWTVENQTTTDKVIRVVAEGHFFGVILEDGRMDERLDLREIEHLKEYFDFAGDNPSTILLSPISEEEISETLRRTPEPQRAEMENYLRVESFEVSLL